MANQLELQTADAIVAAINAATWDEQFRAVRSYADLELPLEQFDTLQVEVITPNAWDEFALDTNESDAAVSTFDIAIRKRFTLEQHDNAQGGIRREELDRLFNLTIAIARYFSTDRFADIEAAWTSTELPQIYDRGALAELHQFTGVVSLTFEIHRTL